MTKKERWNIKVGLLNRCRICNKRKSKKYTRCNNCLEKVRKASKKEYARCKAKGICVNCRKESSRSISGVFCERCRNKIYNLKKTRKERMTTKKLIKEQKQLAVIEEYKAKYEILLKGLNND